MPPTQTARLKGFTLIELMITVAILAIIAAIALPAYTSYMQGAYLAECNNEMAVIQLAEEEFFLENNRYFRATGVANLETASGGIYNSTFTTAAAIAAANCAFTVNVGSTTTITTSYNVVATAQNNVTAGTAMSRGN